MTHAAKPRLRPVALTLLALLPGAHAEDGAELGAVTISERRNLVEQLMAPTTSEGVSRQQLADTVNAVDTEDSFKYLPNVLVRKRFIGDTDAPIASRTTGINASARTLVYADNTLLTPLINNNNGNGSPRWFMVAPEEIERIDVLYGPYSAAFPGNAYGLVAHIATRLPEGPEGSAKVSSAWQHFDYYGTHDSYPSQQMSATLGNRIGDWAFWLSANHLDSHSMPVSFTIAPTASGAAGTALTGSYADRNRTGSAIQVIGAGNLTHTRQDNAKIKLAYEVSPTLQAAYTFGLWQNTADLTAQTYLRNATTGTPFWGASTGQVSFGGNNYAASAIAALFQPGHKAMEHHMHSLSLREKQGGDIDWQIDLSRYEYVTHQERTGTTTGSALYANVATGAGAGKTVDMKGTGWTTADAMAHWRPDGAHRLSLGAHYDRYRLVSPTYTTSGNWLTAANGSLSADARGTTETQAMWLQDVWRLAPAWRATLGARQEWWRAFDGRNLASGTTVLQPARSVQAMSPKGALSWDAASNLLVTASLGRAVRFPTVGELYLTQSVGGVTQTSDPNLKPEDILSGELAFEITGSKGKIRLSLFEEQVKDALISQSGSYPGIAGTTTFMQNIDKTRQRGVELVVQQDDVFMRGLALSGSLTHVDARILANSGYVASSPGATSVGKRTPYVPAWRATAVATYRPNDQWSYTLAGRYSSRLYATVDGTDTNAHTYTGFDAFFVADARLRYRLDRQWSAAVGIDNLNNRKYFLYHPFPQRTAFAELKCDF